MAFHAHHDWSHAEAHAHVERRTAQLTGVASGVGLWLNYLFGLVWLGDAMFWWIAGDARYRRRPPERLTIDGQLLVYCKSQVTT